MFPARVGQRAASLWSGCGVHAATLRLLFPQQLLRLRVIQRAGAGLDGHCVCLHAHMIPKKASPGAAQLLEVFPLRIIPGQEADSLHDLDLLLGAVMVGPTLGWRAGRRHGHLGLPQGWSEKEASGSKTACEDAPRLLKQFGKVEQRRWMGQKGEGPLWGLFPISMQGGRKAALLPVLHQPLAKSGWSCCFTSPELRLHICRPHYWLL